MKTACCLLLLLAVVLSCGCHGSLEAGDAITESPPTVESPYHEVSFSLDPFQICLSDFCYDSERVTIHLEEDQRLELWWYAYGDTREVYATLIMPDGTRCTGRQIHPGGGPIESYPCNPRRWRFDADPGSTGELGFRCSSTYGATSGTRLYPPGDYTLVFQVCGSASPRVDVHTSSEVNMLVKYKIR